MSALRQKRTFKLAESNVAQCRPKSADASTSPKAGRVEDHTGNVGGFDFQQMDADGRPAWRVVYLTVVAAFNRASHELSRE